MSGANRGSIPGGKHPNISTPSHPQGQYATTTSSPNSTNIGIIVAGVVVPLILITIGACLIYAWYRKKYPVRMVIGKDFSRFTNPAYNKRASTLTLVRADANVPLEDPSTSEAEGYVNKGLSLVREDDLDEVFSEEQAKVEMVNETVDTEGNDIDDKNEIALSPDLKSAAETQAINIVRERPKRALLIQSEDFEEKEFDMITESDLGQRTESELSSGNDSTDTHTISLSFSDTFDRKSSRAASNSEQIHHNIDKVDGAAVSGNVQKGSVDAKTEICSENNPDFVMVERETEKGMSELENAEKGMETPITEDVSEILDDSQVADENRDSKEMTEDSSKLESKRVEPPYQTINVEKDSLKTVQNDIENHPKDKDDDNTNSDDNSTKSDPGSMDIPGDIVVIEPSDELDGQTVNDLSENGLASFQTPPIDNNVCDNSVGQSMFDEQNKPVKDFLDTQSATVNSQQSFLTARIEEEIITDATELDKINESWDVDSGNDHGDTHSFHRVEEQLSENQDDLNTQELADVVTDLSETGSITSIPDGINGSENKRPSLSLSRENVYLENTPPTPTVLVQDSIIFESDAGSPIHLDNDTVVQGRERRAFTLDENLQREQAPTFQTNARARHSFDGHNMQGSSLVADFMKEPVVTEKQDTENTDENVLIGIDLGEQINNEANLNQRKSPDINELLLEFNTSEREIAAENDSTQQHNINTAYEQNENSSDISHVIQAIPEETLPQSPANETPQQGLLLDFEDKSKDDILSGDLDNPDSKVPSSAACGVNDFTSNISSEPAANPVLNPIDILIPNFGEESRQLESNSENSALVQIEPSEMTPSSDSSETLSFELIGEDSSSHKSSDMQSNFSEMSINEDTKTPEGGADNVLTRIAVDPFSFDFDDPVVPDLSQNPTSFDNESIENIREDHETESSQLEQSIGSSEISMNVGDGDLSWDLIGNIDDSEA